MSKADTVPAPRYLIRRLIAYYVDMVIAWLLLAVLLGISGFNNFAENFDDRPNVARTESYGTALNWAVTFGAFDVPVVINTRRCGDASAGLTTELMARVENKHAKSMQLCVVRSFGVPSMIFVKWVLETTDANGKVTQESGATELGFSNPLLKISELLGITVLILTSALTTRVWKTTPGKWLLGLRFKYLAPQYPLRREIIKNFPNLAALISFVPFELGWLTAPEVNALGMKIISLAVLIAHIAAVVLLWLYPLRNSKAPFLWSPPGEVISRTTLSSKANSNGPEAAR